MFYNLNKLTINISNLETQNTNQDYVFFLNKFLVPITKSASFLFKTFKSFNISFGLC